MIDQPRLDRNPYDPPESVLEMASESTAVEPPVWQATTLRVSGLLGLILSVVVAVIFGVGTVAQFQRFVGQGGVFNPWGDRVWITRMTSVQLACILAGTISWGLFHLRSWSRYLLTRVTVLPIPTLMVCYVLAVLFGRPRILELPWAFLLSIVLTLPFSITILYLLWSPKKSFESGQVFTWRRVGFLPIIAALVFMLAEGVAYVVLVLSTMGILDLLGVFNR